MIGCTLPLLFVSSIKSMMIWPYQLWRKFRMCIATLCYNLWVLILIFLMESQKWGQPLFWEIFTTSVNALKIRWSVSTQIQSMGIFLQYQLLTPMNHFHELKGTKTGLTKFLSICQAERSKIRWPWHNTCKSICLRNMKMKIFFCFSILVACRHFHEARISCCHGWWC